MKRGISTVVASILLILLAIAAIVIIWVILKGFLQKSASGVETSCLTLNLEIGKAQINASSNILYVQVKRNVGEGNLSGIRFRITNSSEVMIRDRNTSMKELETKTFSFDDVRNVSFINKVEIAGVVSVDNEEKICRIISAKSSLGVYTIPPPTPLEFCFNKTNGTVCGNAYCNGLIYNSNSTCQAGTCISGETQNCSLLGKQCKNANCSITGCGTENKPDGTICDDGNPDTVNESCLSGVCSVGFPTNYSNPQINGFQLATGGNANGTVRYNTTLDRYCYEQMGGVKASEDIIEFTCYNPSNCYGSYNVNADGLSEGWNTDINSWESHLCDYNFWRWDNCYGYISKIYCCPKNTTYSLSLGVCYYAE